jgi:PKD repeat protein
VRTVEVLWGDGTRSTGRKVTHRYRRGGEYTVTVRATDAAGNVGIFEQRVRISPSAT